MPPLTGLEICWAVFLQRCRAYGAGNPRQFKPCGISWCDALEAALHLLSCLIDLSNPLRLFPARRLHFASVRRFDTNRRKPLHHHLADGLWMKVPLSGEFSTPAPLPSDGRGGVGLFSFEQARENSCWMQTQGFALGYGPAAFQPLKIRTPGLARRSHDRAATLRMTQTTTGGAKPSR